MDCFDSVRSIKGIGEKSEKVLNKMNVFDVGDLLEYLPRDYDYFGDICYVGDIKVGEVSAISVLPMARPKVFRKGRFSCVYVDMTDSSGSLRICWYNMPFMAKTVRMGQRYILRGRVSGKNGGLMMEQPTIYDPNDFYKKVGRLHPKYPLKAGITNNLLTKAIKNALEECEGLTEFLPAEIRKKNNLEGYNKAIHDIHFPKSVSDYKNARKRLVFDEVFLYQSALRLIKIASLKKNVHPMKSHEGVDKFIESLPFELTNAQKKVWEHISEDLCGEFLMNRLLQGDVGSGKTMVAVLAMLLCALNGMQAAIMVPTVVLANQHFENIREMLKDTGVRVELLTGSTTSAQKKLIKQDISNGKIDILVGTHALIDKGVEYKNLSLVVTDEQHRFGVRQRLSLSKKGDDVHVLAMSATPIPRSLALVLYGDMDLSIIDEKPANRLPIKNALVDESYRNKAYEFIKEQISMGHQVYIVCPLVEASDNMDLESVTVYSGKLAQIMPDSISVDVLYGSMSDKKKNEVMEKFAAGQTDILVSTTVIEVGIDVANATVMMIENCERFGLATLHQLRGRIGRGKSQSYCIFVTGKDDGETKKKLEVISHENDGFKIAKEDLKLRGQGDFFGERQTGDKLFELAEIYEDADVFEMAAREASNYTFEEISKFYEKRHRFNEKLNRYMGDVSL